MLVACFAISLTACAAFHRSSARVVTVPVADLRAQPHSPAHSMEHDPEQETQVLYGERVRVLKTEGAWDFVEAVEQPEFTHHRRWQGYPGWILHDLLQPLPKAWRPNAVVTAKWATVWHDADGTEPWIELPLGTWVVITNQTGLVWRVRLTSGAIGWMSQGQVTLRRDLARLSTTQRRRAVIRAAEQMLGDPYFWGGRSPSRGPNTAQLTGVDCSGLVNLAYRAAGVRIPRDAHEQHVRARHLSPHQLQPADLICLSEPDHPRKIVHVMLYAGDGWLIEGPGTGLPIRRIEITQRLGRPLRDLKAGDTVDHQRVSFGAYLPPS